MALHPIGDIEPQTDWTGRLSGVEIIVHLANRAHRTVFDPATDREPAAAANLAAAAAAAGVRRIVHMSSALAMGEATRPGMPFRPADSPAPQMAYGRAKLAVERALAPAAEAAGLELVILRPPLVYGPGVKANFRSLLRVVASGLPLPFAGIENRRSLIFLDNLVDVTALACLDPDATGRVLLVRDSVDLSTPELVAALADGLGRRVRLFAPPAPVLALALRAPGLGTKLARLTASLQVDDDEARRILGWEPAVAPAAGLALTARDFLWGR